MDNKEGGKPSGCTVLQFPVPSAPKKGGRRHPGRRRMPSNPLIAAHRNAQLERKQGLLGRYKQLAIELSELIEEVSKAGEMTDSGEIRTLCNESIPHESVGRTRLPEGWAAASSKTIIPIGSISDVLRILLDGSCYGLEKSAMATLIGRIEKCPSQIDLGRVGILELENAVGVFEEGIALLKVIRLREEEHTKLDTAMETYYVILMEVLDLSRQIAILEEALGKEAGIPIEESGAVITHNEVISIFAKSMIGSLEVQEVDGESQLVLNFPGTDGMAGRIDDVKEALKAAISTRRLIMEMAGNIAAEYREHLREGGKRKT